MGKSDIAPTDLAINGGEKAIASFEVTPEPKIGVDEFMELASVWGFGEQTMAALRSAVERDPLPSPHLNRYYNPRPSKVDELEAYARELFGVSHALGVNSGTSALNAAYVGCGIGPGDEVIVPGYTFFATAAAVVACRAIPVIADVDDTLAIDPVDVERKITARTKAIVPVHMGGNCCDMDAIRSIAREHELLVVEDSAQACGGMYKGQYLGTLGDAGCFSISGYKITGAGEAGLVLTDDEWIYTRAQSQHDTAACWRPDRYAKERRPGELFCGQNYRMSELEGAVNLVQLRKTDAQARRYNANMRRIAAGVEPTAGVRLRPSNDIEGDVGYRLALFAGTPEHAEVVAEALRAEGVPAGGRGTNVSRDWHLYSYWEQILEQKTATPEGCPFTCPYYKSELPPYSQEMCPNTLDLLGRAIFISIDQWWTGSDCDRVAQAVNKVCTVLG